MSEFAAASRQGRVRSTISAMPSVGSDHAFDIPAKLIRTHSDMKIWEKSEAYFEYLGFILAINEAVKGKSNSQGRENVSENVNKVVSVLDKLDVLIDETPPVEQPQRFGNVAFRTWFQKMRDATLSILQELFSPTHSRAIPEIVTYLVESFGNSTRIDYGTGHEIAFVMYLCCLFRINLLRDSDKLATGCYIFPRYLDLARKLQKTYRMEPAGSHGVWSLDDYQFVPFIWGSSQLFAHPVIEPSSFLNERILNDYGDNYMFLKCIQFINSVKTGPFAEHSNQLWSISGVSSWSKINSGLIKMYKAEVLSKFPVVQHIVFGSLFTLKPIEHSTGLMTPKFSMLPPLIPSPSASASISTASSKVSAPSAVSSESSEKSEASVESVPVSITSAASKQSEARASKQSEARESRTASRDASDFEAQSGDKTSLSVGSKKDQNEETGSYQSEARSYREEKILGTLLSDRHHKGSEEETESKDAVKFSINEDDRRARRGDLKAFLPMGDRKEY